MNDDLHSNALEISKIISARGYIAYWAGGCVRDRLLGLPPKDIDIATTAKPDDLLEMFPHGLRVGEHFGVIVVPMGGINYDVATFRREGKYLDGRHPGEVSFCGPEEDSRRRDFTINGLFYDPLQDKVIDYVEGISDLNRGIIRAIGSAKERFEEDHLRMLRAVRFASVFNFEIEPKTFAAICHSAHAIASISAERIQQELNRMLLESGKPGDAIDLMRQSGLLLEILPEVSDMIGQQQPPQFHPEGDVYTHTIMMLNEMCERSLQLALSVLFHDVGKPPTAKQSIEPDGSTRIRFNRHAEVGAQMAESILKRLRYSRSVIKEVVYCIKNHMRFKDVQQMRRSKLRRLIGQETFPTELELHRLDCWASHGMMDNHIFLSEKLIDYEKETPLPPALVNGNDILALGVPKGPDVGKVLRACYDHQLEQNSKIGRDELLRWTKEWVIDHSLRDGE